VKLLLDKVTKIWYTSVEGQYRGKTGMDRNSTGQFIKGYKRSLDSKVKQSTTLIAKYKSGERIAWQKGKSNTGCGVKKGSIPWNKGLSMTDKRVQENILSMAKTRKNNGYISKELQRKIKLGTNTPEFKQMARERRAKQVFPLEDTKIERLMERQFKNSGLSFMKHYLFTFKSIYHQVDFLIGNLVVECDGNYWHTLPEVVKRDKEINNSLTNNGYKIIRFWEKDILKNPTACLKIVKKAISFPESVTTIRQTLS